MLILALESSALAASAAVAKDGKIISEAYLNTGLTHSETLLPLVRDCLDRAGASIGEIDALAVASGPGSFTGVRIGVSAVKGLSFPQDIPVYGISTLEAMAWAAGIEGELICPVMDARCQQVYAALFRFENGAPQRLTPDAPMKLDALVSLLRAYPQKPLLIGDGTDVAAANFDTERVFYRRFPEIFRFQRAGAVAFAAFMRYNNGEQGIDASLLAPDYLRLAQAERERAARLMKEETTV
ncbi:MAG: tRNA (adenosine(37)-N6)-threonylcarbamoyltransferase complex dimerization subunit type 1 TsaB [Clostridia bacterium]|nr:tRNA (adenosine(37)-N6)-threonylcarbamoyltransferase complex dimerization subunit type 1 TsaB [Clostridia bacterium]